MPIGTDSRLSRRWTSGPFGASRSSRNRCCATGDVLVLAVRADRMRSNVGRSIGGQLRRRQRSPQWARGIVGAGPPRASRVDPLGETRSALKGECRDRSAPRWPAGPQDLGVRQMDTGGGRLRGFLQARAGARPFWSPTGGRNSVLQVIGPEGAGPQAHQGKLLLGSVSQSSPALRSCL